MGSLQILVGGLRIFNGLLGLALFGDAIVNGLLVDLFILGGLQLLVGIFLVAVAQVHNLVSDFGVKVNTRNGTHAAVGFLKFVIRHAQGGQQLLIGLVHALAGGFALGLCLGQLQLVLVQLLGDIVVLLRHIGHELLVGLCLGAVLPRLGISAQRCGAALYLTGGGINIPGQIGHQVTQQRQHIAVFLLVIGAQLGIVAHFFQLGDVQIRRAGSRHCSFGAGLHGGVGIVQRIGHTACGGGDLVQRRRPVTGCLNRSICGTRNSHESTGYCGNTGNSKRNRTKGNTRHCCKGSSRRAGKVDSRRHTGDTSSRRTEYGNGGCYALYYARIVVDKLGHAGKHIRAHFVQVTHGRGQLLTNSDFQAVCGRFKQRHFAVQIVQHRAGHLPGSAGAVLQRRGVVTEALAALGCLFAAPGHNRLQLGILVRAGNGFRKVGLLLVGQVVPHGRQTCQNVRQAVHVALRIIDTYAVLFQLIGAALGVGGKAGHNGVQGRTGLAALDTGVRHRSQHSRGFLYGVAHGFCSCGACLVGFAQLLHIGVGVTHGIGHHIHKMRGIGCR